VSPPTVEVAGTAVPATPDRLNDLTIDQLRDAARSLPGVAVTGRKADLVDRVVTAAQQQATDTAAAAPAPAPVQSPQVSAEPPAEAPAPAPAPEAPTGAQEAPQAPAATDGGTVTTGGTP
jgi:hypothetical protein